MQKTCSCVGQASDSPLYTITPDCRKRDINECLDNPCAGSAVCFNKDGTTSATGHQCVCPPGMLGDGVNRCDVYVFQTLLQFGVKGLRDNAYDEISTKQALLNSGAIPTGVVSTDIVLTVNDFSGPYDTLSARRRLLGPDDGLQLTVVITSDNALGMQQTTSNINTANAQTALAALYNLEVYLLEPPSSIVQTVDQAFGAVNTVISGFRVDSIVYNDTAFEWVLRVRYVDNSPNTITSLYVSKAGLPPYPRSVQDTFFVSQHPCMQDTSVCCLLDYRSDYVVGSFADNISAAVGTCDAGVRAAQTKDIFDVRANAYLVEHALDGYPNSYVRRRSSTMVDVHLNRFDLRNEFAMRSDTVGGYELSFFLGMAFYTMLPANAIATVASQTRISVTATDTVTFATTSEQDYTFVQYITVGLFQTKYISDAFFTHHMQFAKVAFVLPASLQQNIRTGLVPLTSVRFAVAKTLPDALDEQLWMNPCYSAGGTGLYDEPGGAAWNPLREMYGRAAEQDCALQSDMCVNPPTAQLSNQLVEFWFPIGDGLINASIFSATERYSFYVYFDLSVVDASGRSTITKLFAQAPITELSMSSFCESLSAAQTLDAVTEVSLAVGTVGVERDWDATIVEFNDVVGQSTDLLDMSMEIQAKSIESALLTLAVRGDDAAFDSEFAQGFHLELDSLTTMHFLDDIKYDEVADMMAAGTAWSTRRNAAGYLEVVLSPAVLQTCASTVIPGDVSCAVRNDVVGRTVPQAYAVHPLASSIGTRDAAADVQWLTRHLFGNSGFAREYSANFTNIVRKRYGINDRYNKGWFVNAGFPWAATAGSAAQSILSLSDKMIMIAVITLDDENPTTGPSGGRRMLLEVHMDGERGEVSRTVRSLQDRPLRSQLPAVSNAAVDQMQAVADAMDIKQKWRAVRVDVRGAFAPEMTDVQIRDEVQRRLRMRMGTFAPTAKDVRVAQFGMKRVGGDSANSRRLLQMDMESEGYITLMLIFDEGDNVLFAEDLFQAIYDLQMDNATLADKKEFVDDELLQAVHVLNMTNSSQSATYLSVMQRTRTQLHAFLAGEPIPNLELETDEFAANSGAASLGASAVAAVLSLALAMWMA